MSLDAIMGGLVTVLNGVSGIGKVVVGLQHTPDEKSTVEAYVKNKVLNAWILYRESSRPHDRGMGPDNVRDQHTIAIYGYLAATAAANSMEQHQNMTEGVRVALRANRRLPSGAGFITAPPPTEFAPVMFAGVLCWRSKTTVIGEDVRQGG